MTESGPRKGLWDLMNQKRSAEAAAPASPPPATEEVTPAVAESTPPETPPPAVLPPPVPPRVDRRLLLQPPPATPARGLWAMMQKTVEAPPASNPATADDTRNVADHLPQVARKIDRRLLQRPAPNLEELDELARQHLADAETTEYDRDQYPVDDVPLMLGEEEAPPAPAPAPAPDRLPSDLIAAVSSIPEPRIAVQVEGLSRSALWSIGLGVISLPVSLVAIYPAIWSRIPPSLFGFGALGLGLVAQSEIRRSAGRIKGFALASAGIATGLLGMFAGPGIYTPLDVYGKWSNSRTGASLKQIGLATEAYHQQQHSYPAGGLFKEVKGGQPEPLHGWMTLILPHTPGGDGLWKQIDLKKPYLDPVNQPAMSQTVPAFLAAGGSRELVRGKYGPAHFAGVGGLISLGEGRMAHAGIFDINSDVHREDIADGLSNTMVAGEVSINHPAWGEPHNWRQIGKGLNRDPKGFGNSQHTGAMFVMADGSVRFLSNKTDPKVLQALSTRDGEEGVP